MISLNGEFHLRDECSPTSETAISQKRHVTSVRLGAISRRSKELRKQGRIKQPVARDYNRPNIDIRESDKVRTTLLQGNIILAKKAHPNHLAPNSSQSTPPSPQPSPAVDWWSCTESQSSQNETLQTPAEYPGGR